MKKNYSRLLVTVLASSALTLTGCMTASKSTEPATPAGTGVDSVSFNLPKQIEWQQTKNSKTKNGGIISEWIPKGTKLSNTTVRVIYQKLVPATASNALLAQVAQPLKKNCADVQVTPFKTETKYAGALGQRVVCSKLGKNGFGVVLDTIAVSDKNASYLLISEVKMPASAKVGAIKPKNAKEKQQLANTQQLVSLMYTYVQTLKACDAKKNCQ